MIITPELRSTYDQAALEASKRKIGQGGTSECFLYEFAGTRWLEKRLPDCLLSAPQGFTWFENEARILSKLNGHPSFPEYYGAYLSTDIPRRLVLMMEYIEGQELYDCRRNKEAAIAAGYDIGQGLEAMAKLGIIHRDLKPGNIMVTGDYPDRRGKLIDFGLSIPGGEDSDKTLVTPGEGTPEYMSPEQSKGEELVPQSDWFSFGATLYEAITGKLALGFFYNRMAYLLAAIEWNEKNIREAKHNLVQFGMSETFADAWSLAMHPAKKQRQLRPLQSQLERCLRISGASRVQNVRLIDHGEK